MGELRMQTKEVSANAKHRREQLCVKIRTLTVASKTVGAAQSKLQAPDKLQSGESGHDRLKNLEQMLRMRQQYMISQVAHLYPVKPLNEQSSVDKSGLNSCIIRTVSDIPIPREDGSRAVVVQDQGLDRWTKAGCTMVTN